MLQTDKRVESLANKFFNGEYKGANGKAITDVIAIGVGGSHLGAEACHKALYPYHGERVNVHYLANIDGDAFEKVISRIKPETTVAIIISKTFSTLETLANAKAIKEWYLNSGFTYEMLSKHLIAVSTNTEKAIEFGVLPENILPMWNWVGGRFSVWSAVGLPLAIAVGFERFSEFRAGAYEMDEHFISTPFKENLPVLLALTGIWNCSFLGYESLAVLPYSHALRAFPSYLQQLDMESNGKQTKVNGKEVNLATAPTVFGQEGTNAQHAFMQLMHQSKTIIPAEFIVSLKSQSNLQENHKHLVANCFAQSEALMMGKTYEQAYEELISEGKSIEEAQALAVHKVMPGNRPSTTLIVEQLTPQSLGALLALYEHKIFVQGAMWDLNSFDQWGVELGKKLGNTVLKQMDEQVEQKLSPSTIGLVELFNQQFTTV